MSARTNNAMPDPLIANFRHLYEYVPKAWPGREDRGLRDVGRLAKAILYL